MLNIDFGISFSEGSGGGAAGWISWQTAMFIRGVSTKTEAHQGFGLRLIGF